MDQDKPLPVPTQDEARVLAWAEVREPVERQLAPLGRRALDALAPRPGENVLDVGCGGGETALDLARAVAPGGTVVGIDLSAAVLAFARRAAEGCKRVRFVQADAQAFPFQPASFDAAFSRFGVMFFADPTAAFINIRRSLRPNGQRRKQGPLLEQDPPFDRGIMCIATMSPLDIDTHDLDIAATLWDEADDRPHQHGLAASGGADQTQDFALADVQRQVIEHSLSSETHHEITDANGKLR
jgi:SAM-dependent methyltransferase